MILDEHRKDVMIDIETLGQGSNAPIVAIAACFFNLETGKVQDTFHEVISLKSNMKFGLIPDADTTIWWMNQTDEARAIFDSKQYPSVDLDLALENLNDFLTTHCTVKPRVNLKMWGNGSDFDNVILWNALKTAKVKRIWSINNNRDVRTINDLGKMLFNIEHKKVPFEGIEHYAVDDAMHQIKCICAVFKKLNKKVFPKKARNPKTKKTKELSGTKKT